MSLLKTVELNEGLHWELQHWPPGGIMGNQALLDMVKVYQVLPLM